MNLTTTQTKPRSEPTATRPDQGRPDRQPHVIAGTRPRSSASAGEVVLAYLRLQAAALTALEPRVRADEPDAVHQLRVATRRLRAAFRSFGSVIPRSRSAEVAAELKWLGGVAGAARDGEVLPEHLHARLRSVPSELLIGPVQARVQGHFAPRRAAAFTEVIEALDSPRYAALRAGLDRLTSEPPLGSQADAPARKVLPAGVGRAYRQADQRMRRAWHTPAGPARDVALHQARKSARRARYAAEVTRPAVGRPARRFGQQLKKVQSVLGAHQDTILARQAARELGIGAYLAGENAFSYGLLYQDQTHQAERLRVHARDTWQHAARRRNLRWLP